MWSAINGGTAFKADAHAAQRGARLSTFRDAACNTCVQQSRGEHRASRRLHLLAVHK